MLWGYSYFQISQLYHLQNFLQHLLVFPWVDYNDHIPWQRSSPDNPCRSSYLYSTAFFCGAADQSNLQILHPVS